MHRGWGIRRDEAGRILLLRRSDGLWSVPGGGLDPGERLDQAVLREVREETGLEVDPAALIGVYSDPEYTFTYPTAKAPRRKEQVSQVFQTLQDFA